MTMSGTPCSAARRGRASSSPTPQTSLMRSAPAARAASATAGLVVSTLIGVSGRAARTAAMTGTTRARSSSARHGRMAGPGRFAADVEDVGTLVDHAARLGDGRLDRVCRVAASAR